MVGDKLHPARKQPRGRLRKGPGDWLVYLGRAFGSGGLLSTGPLALWQLPLPANALPSVLQPTGMEILRKEFLWPAGAALLLPADPESMSSRGHETGHVGFHFFVDAQALLLSWTGC